MKRFVIATVLLIALVVSTTACPMDAGGNYVKFNIKEQIQLMWFDDWKPVQNITVTAVPYYGESNPLLVWLGMSPAPTTNLIMQNVSGITDSDGSVILPMYPDVRYQIEVRNNTYVIYLRDNEYTIYIR
jgi:hypothetical protein